MRLKTGASCLLILGLGTLGCSSNDAEDSKAEEVPTITTAEGAQRAIPAAGQLSLKLNLNPGATSLADSDPCALWGDSMLAAPCSIGSTVEDLSTIISTFIAEATKGTPTEKDGGWEFVTTVDRATASQEAIDSFLTTSCSEDESISVENDSLVMRVFVKQKDDRSIDVTLGAGATEATIVDGIVSGNWLQTDQDKDLGKGSMTLNFAKTAELDKALFAAAGEDYVTLCGAEPDSVGSITIQADNTATPATASLTLSEDFFVGSMANQTFSFKFHGEEETEFEMAFSENMVGSANDFTLFDEKGEKSETLNFHLGIRHATGEDFAVEAKLSAADGDREGTDPVTLRLCGKFDGTTLVQGFMGVDSPADLAAAIDVALALDPNNEEYKQFTAASEAAYCPTLEHVKL